MGVGVKVEVGVSVEVEVEVGVLVEVGVEVGVGVLTAMHPTPGSLSNTGKLALALAITFTQIVPPQNGPSVNCVNVV